MSVQYACSHLHHVGGGLDLQKAPRKKFAAKEIIRHPDEVPDTVYRIEAGIVRPFYTGPQGDDALFSDLTTGDYIGDLSAIDGYNLDICYEAITDTNVIVLRRSQFIEILKCSPDFSFDFTKKLCDRVRALNRLHIESRVLPMKARLCAELLRLCSGIGSGACVVSPAPTHAELARRVASQRETVTKQLNQLAKDGIIRQSRGKIFIDEIDEIQSVVDAYLGDLSSSEHRGALSTTRSDLNRAL